MPANINSFVRANNTAKPWWGIGQTIDSKASIEDWMKTTKLDYQIVLDPIFIGAKLTPAIEYVAVKNDETEAIYQIAKSGYTPHQNSELFSLMKSYADANEVQLDTMGSLGSNGGIVWALGKFGDSFALPGNDKIQPYLLQATSHDGTLKTTSMITFIRVVCQNTLRIALEDSKSTKLFSKKHTKNSNINQAIKDAKTSIETYRIQVKSFQEKVNVLSETPISEAQTQVLVMKLTQPKVLDRILAEAETTRYNGFKNGSILDKIIVNQDRNNFGGLILEEIKENQNRIGSAILEAIISSPGSELKSALGTAWGFVNGVSYYVDHESGRSDATRMRSAWFGVNADLKDSAISLASDLAQQTL